MNKLHTLKFGILGLLCFTQMVSFGQSEDLPVEEVEVVKEFEVRLKEVNKVNLTPSLPKKDQSLESYKYNISSSDVSFEYPDPIMRTIAMPSETIDPGYHGYLKGGIGTKETRLIDAAYLILDKELLSIGLEGQYHNVDENNFKSITSTNIHGWGSYKLKDEFELTTDLTYNRNKSFFYGYEPDSFDVVNESDLERRRSFFEFKMGIENINDEVGRLHYYADLNYYNMAVSDTSFNENLLGLNAGISKMLGDNFKAGLDLGSEFIRDEIDSIKYKNTWLFAKPHIQILSPVFNLKIAGNFSRANKTVKLFPVVEMNLFLVEDKFILTGGTDGSFVSNSMRNQLDQNFFLDLNQDTLIYSNYQKYYLGLKGAIGKFEYRGEAGYNQANDLPFYTTNFNDPRRTFDVQFAELDAFYLDGFVAFELFDQLKLSSYISKRFFKTNDAQVFWHTPSFEWNVAASYLLFNEKLTLRGQLFMRDRLEFQDELLNSQKTNAQIDMSLAAEYKIIDRIQIFGQANNLFNNKYERWHRFENIGLTALAGLKIIL